MGHLSAFLEKMRTEGLPAIVMDTFAGYYRSVVRGEKGLLCDRELLPVTESEIPAAGDLAYFADRGARVLNQAVMIVLNGGLGTSMGLTGPKSLLPAKGDRTFLQIIIEQAERMGVELMLMNSFRTDAPTRKMLRKIAPKRRPAIFLQHKFPKILQQDLSPAIWPKDPALEWNPPGHGDIYTALVSSGMLAKLLASGRRYAFICNSDNLGAVLDPALLGYFCEKGFPFMMEVAERTPADLKGGHLARRRSDGRLILREVSQCPANELDAFRDARRYRYFNTNTLWLDLTRLKELIESRHTVPLAMILNPKTLDPRDKRSPAVFQLETAMGAAISVFEGATAVRVPRSRFFPVKKCNQLLALRSDCYIYTREQGLQVNPARRIGAIRIDLDPRYYEKIDDFDMRFSQGVPSLLACEALTVHGDVRFESDVTIIGKVRLSNPRSTPAVIKSGSVIDGDRVL